MRTRLLALTALLTACGATPAAHSQGDAGPVDAGGGPDAGQASKRVVRVMLAGVQVNVLSAEDTVVLKLLFNRPKDLLDIERVVALQGARLDRAYVRRWLDDLVGADDGRVAYWTSLCEQVPVT